MERRKGQDEDGEQNEEKEAKGGEREREAHQSQLLQKQSLLIHSLY